MRSLYLKALLWLYVACWRLRGVRVAVVRMTPKGADVELLVPERITNEDAEQMMRGITAIADRLSKSQGGPGLELSWVVEERV